MTIDRRRKNSLVGHADPAARWAVAGEAFGADGACALYRREVLEALACGTPVATCDVPALREVLDGRATFVEPGDLAALMAAGAAASRPAPPPPPWTWADAARETWRVYQEAAG